MGTFKLPPIQACIDDLHAHYPSSFLVANCLFSIVVLSRRGICQKNFPEMHLEYLLDPHTVQLQKSQVKTGPPI